MLQPLNHPISLADAYKIMGSDGTDIADDVFEFYIYISYNDEKPTIEDDPYDFCMNLFCENFEYVRSIPASSCGSGGVGHVICKVSQFIADYQDVFDKFMEEENSEDYKPSNPMWEGKVTIDSEDFYDLYMTTIYSLIAGYYAEEDYAKLARAITEARKQRQENGQNN